MANVVGVLFGPPGGGSFIASGEAALARAAGDPSNHVRVEHWTETGPEARESRLRDLAATHPDLIVLHGAQGEAPVAAVAAEFPGVAFAVIQGRSVAANVASYEVMLEQPAFVAGALAAWSSRTGCVGHLSGERVGAGLRGRAAFAGGMAHADASVRLASVFCGAQHDAELAERCAKDLAGGGADILFTMLGTGRAGATRACRAAGMRQIGDGADWCAVDPGLFIASICTDAGWAVARAIEDHAAGRLHVGEHVRIGMRHPEVCRLALGHGIDAATRLKIDRLSQAVTCGDAVVPEHWEEPTLPGPT